MERLREKTIWAIFANLSLPDSHGLDTIDKLLQAAGCTDLVIGGIEDEDLCTEALRHGAKDYLLEGHIDRYRLTVPYATWQSARRRKKYCSQKRNAPQ